MFQPVFFFVLSVLLDADAGVGGAAAAAAAAAGSTDVGTGDGGLAVVVVVPVVAAVVVGAVAVSMITSHHRHTRWRNHFYGYPAGDQGDKHTGGAALRLWLASLVLALEAGHDDTKQPLTRSCSQVIHCVFMPPPEARL